MTESSLHDTLAHVIKGLNTEPTGPWTHSKAELAIGLFVQEHFPVKDSFKKRLEDYYDGTASNVDFYNSSNEATDFINT